MRHPMEDRLDAYLMDSLPQEARLDLERHLAACWSCRETVEEARRAGSYLQWLTPEDSAPEPGPDFYARVQESIERKRLTGWFASLSVSRPRLAYPLFVLGFLLLAWTLTFPAGNEEDVLAMEFPLAQFSLSSPVLVNPSLTSDDVISSLVEQSETDDD